jgi:mannose/cellobiose epimerase-like protein (N-acyl-D-glucosamine 2-epimerase family)
VNTTNALTESRPTGLPWTSRLSHRRWLDAQADSLTAFARASVRPAGGFWWLDGTGHPDPAQPQHTWIVSRMTHVFALAHLRGEPGAGPIVDHGLAALDGLLRDPVHGGWYGSVDDDGVPVEADKAAYPHAFVVLAAASGVHAGRPGADRLLRQALDVVEAHFWDETAGRVRETWSRDWSTEEPYRGANSSMHMVEAYLAAGTATGDPRWFDRALRICEHLVHGVAAAHAWRLPEHFTTSWEPMLDYNRDRPADPFRPYGSTIGHWLEWSRLLLQVESAVPGAPAWLLDDARSLFEASVRRGWAVDGADGLVYTVDWTDTPIVRSRMHWVIAEAIGAAATLSARTGEPIFDEWYRRFWDFAAQHHIDTRSGSWHHELAPDNRPVAEVWHGKPDVYHAYQAALLPQLPIAPAVAAALRGRPTV